MLKKVDLLAGGVGYLASSIIVCCSITAGCKLLPPPVKELNPNRSVEKTIFYWDGGHYRSIAANGYSYSPDRPSEVAFFPLYPFAARALSGCAGISISAALIAISNCFLLGSFVLLHAYARARFPDLPDMPIACLIAFTLYSPVLFFHLPYSEPLFVFLTLLAFLAFHHNSSLGTLAIIIGAATATRPVGICLLPLIGFASYRRGGSRLHVLWRACCYMPIAWSGLLCFMLLQYLVFSEPLAFIKTQYYWRRQFPIEWPDKLSSLAVFEPFWGVFDPSSSFYWQRSEKWLHPGLSLVIFNRLAFAFTLVLLYIGFNLKLLTSPELVISFLLILVPYITKGYDNSMTSMARFTAVVLPLYFVAGWLLLRLPRSLAITLALLSCLQLLTFAALFGAGYEFY